MEDFEKASREVKYGFSGNVPADETADSKPGIIDVLQRNIDPWNASWITDVLESIALDTEDNTKSSVGYVRSLILAIKEIASFKARVIAKEQGDCS